MIMEKMRKILVTLVLLVAALFARAQEYGVVGISVCNLRETPEYSAEMISQAILGTPVRILEWGGSYSWPRVQTPDGYTGWVHKDAIVPMRADEINLWNSAPKAIVTSLWAVVRESPRTNAPALSDAVSGNRLILCGSCGRWLKVSFPDGRIGYISKADATPEMKWRKSLIVSPEAVVKSALEMKGFPYLWAGMSPKGMDCSGFVRTVLFMHDIIIPRDAGPQSRVGTRIIGLDELLPGDLVFFGRQTTDGPRVSHVGIYIGGGRFIHSLGYVKIGSFRPEDPLYDDFNTGRYLFASRLETLYGKSDEADVSTTLTNPLYSRQ